jgi:hypothetical protein
MQVSSGARRRLIGFLTVIALADIVTLAAMLWQDDRASAVVLAGLNLITVLTAVARVRAAASSMVSEAESAGDRRVAEVEERRGPWPAFPMLVPDVPAERSALRATGTDDAAAGLEEFPSEHFGPSSRPQPRTAAPRGPMATDSGRGVWKTPRSGS